MTSRKYPYADLASCDAGGFVTVQAGTEATSLCFSDTFVILSSASANYYNPTTDVRFIENY